MNYLAHFHLAWPDDGLVTGGLEGDYYKGPLRGDLPKAIEAGVKLHRSIDAYTDSHPAVESLRLEFPAPLRRYAGILIDLSFDHYLCAYWPDFADLEQQEFNQRIYKILKSHEQHLSAGSRRMADRLIEHDILTLYQHWETVPASAARVGERFKRHNPFIDIEAPLTRVRPKIEAAFLEFYPDLVSYVNTQRH